MLVVLSGCATIGKGYLSMAISVALNNLNKFSFGGYIVDFTKWPTEVYNTKGELVHRPATDTNEGIDKISGSNGTSHLIDQLKLFQDVYILNNNKVNNYHSDFYSGYTDFYGEMEEHYSDFDRLFLEYKNKKTKTLVVTGVFSKDTIQDLKRKLGKNNVMVYNITRNPSTSFLLDDDLINSTGGIAALSSQVEIGEDLFSACLSAITLSQLEGVITLKYEDLIQNNTIKINNRDVTFTSITKHNDNLTNYEFDNMKDIININKDKLNAFNQVFKNLHNHTELKKLPNDIFDALGYEPLIYEQILS